MGAPWNCALGKMRTVVQHGQDGSTTFGAPDPNIKSGVARGWGALSVIVNDLSGRSAIATQYPHYSHCNSHSIATQ